VYRTPATSVIGGRQSAIDAAKEVMLDLDAVEDAELIASYAAKILNLYNGTTAATGIYALT